MLPRSADTRRLSRVPALQRPGGSGAESRLRRVHAVLTQAAPSQVGAAEITLGRRVQAAAPSPFGGAESRRCRDQAAAQIARLQLFSRPSQSILNRSGGACQLPGAEGLLSSGGVDRARNRRRRAEQAKLRPHSRRGTARTVMLR